MRTRPPLITPLLCSFTTIAYLSLAVWMHIWTLEAGPPVPGEHGQSHHQVCTWIGTSGEAAFTGSILPLLSQPTCAPSVEGTPALPMFSCSICAAPARAPPDLSL